MFINKIFSLFVTISLIFFSAMLSMNRHTHLNASLDLNAFYHASSCETDYFNNIYQPNNTQTLSTIKFKQEEIDPNINNRCIVILSREMQSPKNQIFSIDLSARSSLLLLNTKDLIFFFKSLTHPYNNVETICFDSNDVAFWPIYAQNLLCEVLVESHCKIKTLIFKNGCIYPEGLLSILQTLDASEKVQVILELKTFFNY